MVFTFETLVSLRRRYESEFLKSHDLWLSGNRGAAAKFFTRWGRIKRWGGWPWLMAGPAATLGIYPNGAEAMRISRGGVRR